ncbi:MAG: hypothetical protein AB1941_29365, partial [Gemmatimonadota bacterium]
LPAVHCLLATYPILALSFFIGGVTMGEFVRVTLALATALGLSLSLALCVSAVSWDGRKAVVGATLLVLAVSVVLPFGGLARASGTAAPTVSLLTPSPTLALFLVPAADYAARPTVFWHSLALTVVMSGTALGLATLVLPRAWQDRPAKRPRGPRLRRLSHRGQVTPRPSARDQHLLELNPILWLASRGRWSSVVVWGFLLLAALLWLGAYDALANQWLAAPVVLLTFYFLHAILKLWVAWEASRRFAEDRQSGVLELLLCTPLGDENIWRGWLINLKRRFFWPIAVLLVVEFGLLYGGTTATGWRGGNPVLAIAYLAGMGMLVADAYAASWVGLWQGLIARNSTRACLRTIVFVLILPGAAFLGVLGVLGLFNPGGGFSPPLGLLVVCWFGVGYLVDLGACGWAMSKLADDFRQAAARTTR